MPMSSPMSVSSVYAIPIDIAISLMSLPMSLPMSIKYTRSRRRQHAVIYVIYGARLRLYLSKELYLSRLAVASFYIVSL